jgi:hypothetical protein
MRKFTTFCLLLISTYSFADHIPSLSEVDCAETDIRTTNPKIKKSTQLQKHFSGPRNQDSVGWCYAFTAADLITAEIGIPVSAIHTSAMYNKSIFNSDEERITKEMERAIAKGRYTELYEGGWAQDAIDLVIKQGWVCTEEGLPFDVQKPNLIDDLIKGLEALKVKARNEALSNELTCKELSNLLDPYKLMSVEVQDIAKTLTSQNLNITMEHFSRAACKEAIKTIPNLKVVKIERPTDGPEISNYFKRLNENLNKGKPIAIDYKLNQIVGQDGLHAGIITGRRWKDGACQYKIRNTWGQSCGSYLKSIECIKSEGSFWISHEEMFKSSLSIHYISN